MMKIKDIRGSGQFTLFLAESAFGVTHIGDDNLQIIVDPKANFSTERDAPYTIAAIYTPGDSKNPSSVWVRMYGGTYRAMIRNTKIFAVGDRVAYFVNYRAAGVPGGWRRHDCCGEVKEVSSRTIVVLRDGWNRTETVSIERVVLC